MFQLLVDDHLVGQQLAMSPTEQVELVTLADEFDTDRQVRIGYLRSMLSDRAVVAEPVMGVLRDGVDDSVRFRCLDQFPVERLAPHSVRRLRGPIQSDGLMKMRSIPISRCWTVKRTGMDRLSVVAGIRDAGGVWRDASAPRAESHSG